MSFGRLFAEGVKRAIQVLKKSKPRPRDLADAADKVRKAAQKLGKKR